VQPPRELLLDHRAAAGADFVQDQLVRHHAEDDLLAAFDRDERALAGVDRAHAHLAGRRVGVELLRRARE
jgi:hypothetical protein